LFGEIFLPCGKEAKQYKAENTLLKGTDRKVKRVIIYYYAQNIPSDSRKQQKARLFKRNRNYDEMII